MGKAKKAVVLYHGKEQIAYDVTDKNAPVLMDEKYLRQWYPDIGYYTDARKWKTMENTLNKMEVRVIEIPSFLPNARRKLYVPTKRWNASSCRKPTGEDYSKGVRGLLDIAEIWENPFIGSWMTASLLIAMHCGSLRWAGPQNLSYVTEIRNAPPELIDLMTQLDRVAVRKSYWEKKCGKARIKTRRESVLDYRRQSIGFPSNVREFAEVSVKLGKGTPIRLPALYENTIAVVIGADAKQLRETLPLMDNAYACLINCAKPDGLSASVLKASDMNSVSNAKIQAVKESALYIAALLRWWWGLTDGEKEWAAEILAKAKGRLVKPSGDYISLSPNPVKLRHAVHYEVTMSFLEIVVGKGFLPREEAERYGKTVKDAFYPEPIIKEAQKRMEDPDMFPDLMRSIALDNTVRIVAQDERFVKTDKKFGALRLIGNALYLVMPEEQWANAYKKAAKNAGLETSFSQSDGWERKLQAILANADLIKHTGTNPRYRYNLYGDGKKDTTYVVAILWDDVKPQE